jgi:peptidoglycan/xylan/chitin deacetylase (PgdA/CDA1 family)
MPDPRLSVCITWDFDATSPWVASTDELGPGYMSRGESGAAAIPRILALLRRHDVRTTFFVVGHTALAYPDAVKAIIADGHEIGHHGWVHEDPYLLDREREEWVFDQGLAALDAAVGVRPVGYRAPGALHSHSTVDILLQNGMLYDASCSASDFEPYYFRQGDRFPKDGMYEFGEPVDLVAIPFAWTLTDFAHLELVPGSPASQNLPAHVVEMWRGEFDAAYAEFPGGVFDLTLHPQSFGRAYRLTLLDQLLTHMEGQDGVVFEPMVDVARRFKEQNPLAEWTARKPVQAPGNHDWPERFRGS